MSKFKTDNIPSDVQLMAVVTKFKGMGKPQLLLHEVNTTNGTNSYGTGRCWVVDLDEVKIFNKDLYEERHDEKIGKPVADGGTITLPAGYAINTKALP